MRKIYSGKTKDVFELEDGNVLLHFKDSVTGTGNVIDSGGNQVVGEVFGKGAASCAITAHFFNLLENNGLHTHFIKAGESPDTMLVKKADSFGLEVVCREKAWGSFVKRYGSFVRIGTPLPSLIEFTLKDDEKEDPLINEDSLLVLNIATKEEIMAMKNVAKKAAALIKSDLSGKGLDLIDIKFEFGKVKGDTVIIDEISGDTMRAAKGGQVISQKDLTRLFFD